MKKRIQCGGFWEWITTGTDPEQIGDSGSDSEGH